jgi:muconolactone D-isomerase
VQFLVQIHTSLPEGMTSDEREALIGRERARGKTLREQGTISHIWRIPGTIDNVGVWESKNPDDLHAAIASLPAFHWMTVEVTALATHPLMEH